MRYDSLYWTPVEKALLTKASNFKELHEIARRIILRMPAPRGQVCGPISTGGKGSIKENLKEFEKAISYLEEQGQIVFNQLPFEDPMDRILRVGQGTPTDTLLNEFYLPIFEARLVSTLFFLDNWQTSAGATWEHEQARRLKLEIVYLPELLA